MEAHTWFNITINITPEYSNYEISHIQLQIKYTPSNDSSIKKMIQYNMSRVKKDTLYPECMEALKVSLY